MPFQWSLSYAGDGIILGVLLEARASNPFAVVNSEEVRRALRVSVASAVRLSGVGYRVALEKDGSWASSHNRVRSPSLPTTHRRSMRSKPSQMATTRTRTQRSPSASYTG